jgi:hypothetical protein
MIAALKPREEIKVVKKPEREHARTKRFWG